MLRTLFEAVESSVGPSVDGAGWWAWVLGLALTAVVILTPLVKAALATRMVGTGLSLGVTIRCKRCGTRSTLRTPTCESCSAPLPVTRSLRMVARWMTPPPPSKSRLLRWAPAVLGAGGFLALSFLVFGAGHALAPVGKVERLFVGLGLLAWAGLGLLLREAFGLGGLRPLGRLKALIFSVAAGCAVVTSFAVAQAARPETKKPVATLVAEEGAVLVNGLRLSAPSGEVSVEYQLLEGRALGLVVLTPLAVTADGQVPLTQGTVERWLTNEAWSRATQLHLQGLSVRRLTERFQVAPGLRASLVVVDKELRLEPAAP